MQDPNPGKAEDLIATAMQLTRDAVQQDSDQVENVDLKRLLGHIKESLFDHNFSLRRLRRSGKFPANAFEALYNQTQRPLKAYITGRKMEGACWLLAKPHVEIWRIAKFAGYSTTAGFDKAFTKWANCPPGDYRNRMLSSANEKETSKAQTDDHVLWWRAKIGALGEHEIDQLFERFGSAPTQNSPTTDTDSLWYFTARNTPLEQVTIEMLMRVLMRLPIAQQRALLRHRIRFDSPGLFHSIGDKSLEASRRGNHENAIELGRLAIDSLEGSEFELGQEFSNLWALGRARLANAYRLAGEFDEAEKIFATLTAEKGAIKTKGSFDDPEILALLASLRLFQRRFTEARELLTEAIVLCEKMDLRRLVAQCLTQRAAINAYIGDPSERIPDLSRALVSLKTLNEPRLQLVISNNLAHTHTLVGDYDRAATVLAEAKKICTELNDESGRHHQQWIEGIIKEGRGDFVSAEKLYLRARTGFFNLHLPGHGAMATLQLAHLYHGQGRTSEVVFLVGEIVPVLEHFRHSPGIMTALKIFQDAITAERVSSRLFETASNALIALWLNPTVNLEEVQVS